ncbi:SPOR domain-containing protein [Hymenobacter arizonensis]|uniref:Sporulation related domain-containing protein n=1 Tax=Hymenobacter arizonensis TaxID=1227077 RepID=A0A1I5U5W8_HYMAR|nr:SPOR domain-containing protein [Hymenobacter arizonensis]SFP90672.1 Sporulation related domain-containing protein [Hymenobacter arizonensis]
MLHLADHIRPLLRDHDCVIIPDFGGLVADVSPARAQPGRQALSPPTKLVAFNQALTRNDGLLVDALSQHLGVSIAQAREAVRTAVAGLQRELEETNRTELPGVGIFRRAVGRGLAFEYTGTDNLLASAFGLPELAARPVRATDSRAKSPQPALRGAATRRSRWARLVPGGLVAAAVGLVLLVNYQIGALPTTWQKQLPQLEWAQARPAPAITEVQQATLGQHDFVGHGSPAATEGMTPLETPATTPVPQVETQPAAVVPEETSAAIKPEALVAAPATVATEPAVAFTTEKPAASSPIEAAPVAATKPAAATAPAVAKAVVAAKTAKPAEVSSTTIKNRTGRYYVIAGAYRSLNGAEKGRQTLARTGHASYIILPHPGSRLFRLTAGDYPDLASAQREAQRLRITTRCDYNTLKF